MRKHSLIIGILVSVFVLGWVAAGALGAVGVFETQFTADFFGRSAQSKHRLVGTLLCEEPVTTFLSVWSLHKSKVNAVKMVWTDADGLQSKVEKALDPNTPLQLSCEDVPGGFSQVAPVMVHVDSRYRTRGTVLHVVRGSPIQGADAEYFQSALLPQSSVP